MASLVQCGAWPLPAGESDPLAESIRQQINAARETSEAIAEQVREEPPAPAAGGDPLFDKQRFIDDLSAVWRQQVDEVKLWWQEMASSRRQGIVGGAGVGAVIGLVLGLVMPYLAASLQSAIVGSMLILFAGRTLLLKYAPAVAGVLPDSWRGVLLSLGLITLLGVLIQWTLRKKKADE